MIPTKGEISVAWRGCLGPFVARLRIPKAVPPAHHRANFFLVTPTDLLSCSWADPDIPDAADFDSLLPEARGQFEELFRTELVVHQSVIQHGAILFIRGRNDDGSLCFG